MAEVQVHEDAIVQPLSGATSANTEILSGNVDIVVEVIQV
jgi:hypothetical protein